MEHYNQQFLDMSNLPVSLKLMQKFQFKLHSFIKYVKILTKLECEELQLNSDDNIEAIECEKSQNLTQLCKSFTTLKHILLLLLSKQPTILFDGITPVLLLIDNIIDRLTANLDFHKTQLNKHYLNQFYEISKNKKIALFKSNLTSFIEYVQLRTQHECNQLQIKTKFVKIETKKNQTRKQLCKMFKIIKLSQSFRQCTQLTKEMQPVFKIINQTIRLFQRVALHRTCRIALFQRRSQPRVRQIHESAAGRAFRP